MSDQSLTSPNSQTDIEPKASSKAVLVYTPAEVGELLNLSKNSVNTLLRSGKLRAVRFGRKWLIPRSAVHEYLK
jgi:excisionase family DNA binding protein